jgi:hypothetical protein
VATTKQRMLEQAAKHLGREELAGRLNVPESLLQAWIDGHASMPERKLLTLADLLEELSAPPDSSS